MSSGVLSSLAVDYSEYFPVSSFKLHRGVSVINNSQNGKPTKLQIESQNVREIPPKQPRMSCVREGKSILTGVNVQDGGRKL